MTEDSPSVLLLPKRDVRSFVKRQDSSICCSLDVFCFACGRKKRSAFSRAHFKPKRSLEHHTIDGDDLDHDTDAIARIAHRDGLVPILSRGLTMPGSFSLVAHGNTADDMRDIRDFGESPNSYYGGSQQKMFGLLEERR